MAELDIIPNKDDIYTFISNGCRLKYFVVWIEGQSPTPEKWKEVFEKEDNYYEESYHLEKGKLYHFHVYSQNDFRGKMQYFT